MIGYGYFFNGMDPFSGFMEWITTNSTTQQAKNAQDCLPTMEWKWGKNWMLKQGKSICYGMERVASSGGRNKTS